MSIHLTHRNDCEHHVHLTPSQREMSLLTHRSLRGSMALRSSFGWTQVAGRALVQCTEDSYLVDPASSHMLVSKIKPCMSKYKHLIL